MGHFYVHFIPATRVFGDAMDKPKAPHPSESPAGTTSRGFLIFSSARFIATSNPRSYPCSSPFSPQALSVPVSSSWVTGALPWLLGHERRCCCCSNLVPVAAGETLDLTANLKIGDEDERQAKPKAAGYAINAASGDPTTAPVFRLPA